MVFREGRGVVKDRRCPAGDLIEWLVGIPPAQTVLAETEQRRRSPWAGRFGVLMLQPAVAPRFRRAA